MPGWIPPVVFRDVHRWVLMMHLCWHFPIQRVPMVGSHPSRKCTLSLCFVHCFFLSRKREVPKENGDSFFGGGENDDVREQFVVHVTLILKKEKRTKHFIISIINIISFSFYNNFVFIIFSTRQSHKTRRIAWGRHDRKYMFSVKDFFSPILITKSSSTSAGDVVFVKQLGSFMEQEIGV